MALAYQNPQRPELFAPRRDPDGNWRRQSANLLEEFRSQELESLKQTGAAASQQSEPLLLEDLLRLNLSEDSKVSPDLQRLLLATRSELPLTLNEQVSRYVNYFLRRGRGTLRASLRRAGAYQPMISRTLAENGLPQELIYLVQAESGFRPTARSSKRATGMWQFVSWRGKEYGLNQNRQVDERLDPERATQAAARHLADLYAQFGDWYLAMAAYNCGPGCVQRAVERTGHADYWEFVRRKALPRETSNYVPVILAMTLLAKNPDVFDIDDVVPESPIDYDTVQTQSRISVNLIADATGSTPAQIKRLNPALLGQATPDGPYSLRIPRDTTGQFHREIGAVPSLRRLSWRRHLVLEGETLAQIALRYKSSAAEVASVNRLGASQPPAGTRITVPASMRPEPARPAAPRGVPGGVYQVRSGDTLADISKRYGVSVEQLQQWNGLRTTRLVIGQRLRLEARPGTSPRRQVASSARSSSPRPN